MITLPPLVEYESVEGVELSEEAARRLRAASKGVLNVEPDEHPGRWVLTAKEYVGSLVTDDARVLIRPKIRPENLFLMLEVGLPESAWQREVFDYATTDDLLPSIVGFFARTTETVVARGLLRSYRAEEERLVALRGRLNLAAQFKSGGIKTPIACRFDEFSSDIAENRYLRGAIRLAMRVPGVLAEDRQRLLRLLASFEDVADVVVHADDLDTIPITRLNQHYEPALRLAKILLANLTLQDQAGKTAASSFLLDMNLLFERFVEHRLRSALLGRLQVLGQSQTYLGTGRQVLMKPDLVFRRRGEVRYVGDIKYKLTSEARARNSDAYQLLAYATALDLPEGVLIYALADGGVPERSVTVRHAGKVLHTYAVDLSGDTAAVEQAIEDLADWIWRRSVSAGLLIGPD